ncbi:MAG: hypothetical protein OJF50_002935 [Nitrospira sp.]|nr:hypothetical protein [Nitrospira sp.]
MVPNRSRKQLTVLFRLGYPGSIVTVLDGASLFFLVHRT